MSPISSNADEATLIKDFSQDPVKDPQTYPILEIVTGPKIGTWFSLDKAKAEVSIGRSSTNDILLQDSSVSRAHAVVANQDGNYYLKDIGSRNGTFLNDRKIEEDHPLKHGDRVKLGIYVLKFLLEPEKDPLFDDEFSSPKISAPSLEEAAAAMLVKNEAAQTDTAPVDEALEIPDEKPNTEIVPTVEENPNPVSETALEAQTDALNQSLEVLPQEAVTTPIVKKKSSPLKALSLLVFLALLGGGAYFAYRYYLAHPGLIAKLLHKSKPASIPPVQNGGGSGAGNLGQTNQGSGQAIPQTQPVTMPEGSQAVLLEVEASPMPAKIYFYDKELGMSPFKQSIKINPNTDYELTAVYYFEHLGRSFTEKRTFRVAPSEELKTVRFEGSVGTLNVKSLPQNTQVYLEGTFVGSEVKSQAVKLNEIYYKRPLYLPFGNYIFEIKRNETLPSSPTPVDVVKYRREFSLAAQTQTQEMFITDEDLKIFPAFIKSSPDKAQIIIDGKNYGETPYNGNLPLGPKELIIRKDGYFDTKYPLTLSMNTPLTLELSLQTSQAGNFMNKAREYFKQQQYGPAIEQLGEALKQNPSAKEQSAIQWMLGECYLKSSNYDLAITWFEQAKANPEYKGKGDLGIAEAASGQKNNALAMTKLVDIIVNEKDPQVKADAEAFFHKVSPLKSAIFISSDPVGAKITINDQELPQQSPIILSDLALGAYRVKIEAPGYKVYESQFDLMASTLKPVIVKLKPLQ